MKKTILILASGFWLLASAPATPVLFPLKSMFPGQSWNKTFIITARYPLLTDGTNFFSGTTLFVTPAGGTNPVVQLRPNCYTVAFPDSRTGLIIYVTNSASVISALNLTTNIGGYYYTNVIIGGGSGTATNIDNASGTNVNLHGFSGTVTNLFNTYTNNLMVFTNGLLQSVSQSNRFYIGTPTLSGIAGRVADSGSACGTNNGPTEWAVCFSLTNVTAQWEGSATLTNGAMIEVWSQNFASGDLFPVFSIPISGAVSNYTVSAADTSKDFGGWNAGVISNDPNRPATNLVWIRLHTEIGDSAFSTTNTVLGYEYNSP